MEVQNAPRLQQLACQMGGSTWEMTGSCRFHFPKKGNRMKSPQKKNIIQLQMQHKIPKRSFTQSLVLAALSPRLSRGQIRGWTLVPPWRCRDEWPSALYGGLPKCHLKRYQDVLGISWLIWWKSQLPCHAFWKICVSFLSSTGLQQDFCRFLCKEGLQLQSFSFLGRMHMWLWCRVLR